MKLEIRKFDLSVWLLLILICCFISIVPIFNLLEMKYSREKSIVILLIVFIAILIIYYFAWSINFFIRNNSFFSTYDKSRKLYMTRRPYKNMTIAEFKKRIESRIEKRKYENNVLSINTKYYSFEPTTKEIKVKFTYNDDSIDDISNSDYYIVRNLDGKFEESDFVQSQGINCVVYQEKQGIKLALEIKTSTLSSNIRNVLLLKLLTKMFKREDRILLINDAILISKIIINMSR